MRVSEAIVGRQSIRAFLSDRPVSNETIEGLLNVAGRAPSGSNIQPWQVYVVRGERKSRITVNETISNGCWSDLYQSFSEKYTLVLSCSCDVRRLVV